jgi:2-polyprenyl-6-methoxyphenol hydroxylase-like FAD-dependent oxidoreductase
MDMHVGGQVEGRRAVVLGGSIAGLLAARVLVEHYAQVQVLDRDDLDLSHGLRRGVPQARHIHALLPRGREILEELFPGLTAELIADGATSGDLLGAARLHLSGHRFRRRHSDLHTISASRPFLEDRVRARVRRLPNVRFVDACDVVGLVTDDLGQRVVGARILRRADGSAEETVDADLVVDALGRGSRTPVWLQGSGYEPPDEDRIELDLTYATRRYRLPADALDGDWGTLQGPTVTRPRGGTLARIEGDTWMVTLFGLLGEQPPTSDEGFLAFARSLTFPDIHGAIRDARPLDDPIGFRFPASVRRRYERTSALPDGLVPVGDSVCSFNPIYGQGMTVAGLGALALREHLRRRPIPDPRRFVDGLADVLDAPWDMAVGGDLAIPGVQGPRTRRVQLAGAYMARLHAAAAHDADLATAFARVMALVEPPETLMRPRVALRGLRPGVPRRSGPPEHQTTRDRPQNTPTKEATP